MRKIGLSHTKPKNEALPLGRAKRKVLPAENRFAHHSVPAIPEKSVNVHQESTADTHQEPVVDTPIGSHVESTHRHTPHVAESHKGVSIMQFTKSAKSAKSTLGVVYIADGVRGSIRASKSLINGNEPPNTLEEFLALVVPKGPSETKEARKARLADMTPAQKLEARRARLAKQQASIAKAEEKLAKTSA